ncbi:MAG TPA: TonB-dependent receptor plug domain-containing protein [Opitutaceae bacterium]|nr:TonB-dependent receptor plug domain-containing protein [Opitutaceae bacterium]
MNSDNGPKAQTIRIARAGMSYAVALFALVITPRALCQTAANPPPAAPAAAEEEQVVKMDPFTVTTETEGYRAVDTLGGARVATKLVDTPSALSVITKSLMDDVGITNAQDLFIYTTNNEVAGLYGNYSGVAFRGNGVNSNAEAGRLQNPTGTNRARGLSPMDNTRNYFGSEIPWDSFNIFRVDISRGPNSFLYGVGSPSGISNYSTNEAVFKDTGSIETKLGSFGTTRESLDYNRVLIPEQLAVRLDVLNDDTQYQQKPAFNHSQRAYLALRYDPKTLDTAASHMKIEANAEVGRVRSNNPRELPPMDFISGYFDGVVNKKGYDPFSYPTGSQLGGVGTFSGLSPWVNAQDYHYLWPGPNAAFVYDGRTGALLQSMTTLNSVQSVAGGTVGSLPQAAPMYISGFTNYAITVNNRDPSKYVGAFAGSIYYNNKSLTDPSIFDFYNKLIDGPNKQEWQNWKSFNVTAEESLLNGRVSLQGIVDHQEFDQGQVSMWGYTEPFITVDLDAYSIMYPPNSFPGLAVKNPNEGRPLVAGDFGSGDNSAHYIHDNYQITANWDLRVEDYAPKSPLASFLGHHSITALVGDYRTRIENRTWAGNATDVAFANAMGDPLGLISANRGVDWVSYLGPSMVNATSPAGLNLSNVANYLQPQSGSILNFNATWNPPAGVNPGDPWTDPANGASTQANNLANYRGWTTMPVNVLNWHDDINDLYFSGNQTLQVLQSAAFMYQGHLWDDMIIPEYGWRQDTIKQSSSNAPLDPNTHVASMNYGITGPVTTIRTNSNSYGLTLHLPKSIRGTLPLGTDVSAYYFHGNNESPKVRYDFDDGLLPAETGKTDDYGIQVDTLNGHATVRLTVFKTIDKNAPATSGAADPLGNNGYYLYLLPAWGAADAAAFGQQLAVYPAAPNDWGFTNYPNYGSETATHNIIVAAVADWKANFAKYFPQSFFDAYGLGVNVNAITTGNWVNVYNQPNASPITFPWNIANTGSGKINGSFPIISEDLQSKGYEIEATVRPVSNWDLTFNASKVNTVQTALGASTVAFIQAENAFFSGPAGDLPLWGFWGGAWSKSGSMDNTFLQNIWSGYLLQSAQKGCQQPELSVWNFKAITNYSFKSSALKGFNVGGGVRWASKPILGYAPSKTQDALGNDLWYTDVTKPLYGKIDEHVDAWIGYQTKLSSKLDWRLQLNVHNVGEKPHLVPVSVEPDGTPAHQRIEMGQTFELSSRFMF